MELHHFRYPLISFETLSPRFYRGTNCNRTYQFVFALCMFKFFVIIPQKLYTCLARPYNVDVSKYCWKNCINWRFFSFSDISQLSIPQKGFQKRLSYKNKIITIFCMFFVCNLLLQFYFSLQLMFKYFAIHMFFTPAWDFTSVFLTGVKSDQREISLCLELVNNIRSLYGDQGKFTSLHCRLPKWNHTCNHPLMVAT